MRGALVLIVDDEPDILELIQYNLEKQGYRTITAKNGEEALRITTLKKPDLMLLDLMLPGLDGLQLCRRLKQQEQTSGIPVIMLTAKTDESDIITGLEIGAEDYITKPFSIKVLIARIRTVLRRKADETLDKKDVIQVHNINIDDFKHAVKVDNKSIELSATEYNILKLLSAKPGWVFTRSQIINSLKGDNYSVTERTIDVHILGLRKSLGDSGKYIETIRGTGYKLREE